MFGQSDHVVAEVPSREAASSLFKREHGNLPMQALCCQALLIHIRFFKTIQRLEVALDEAPVRYLKIELLMWRHMGVDACMSAYLARLQICHIGLQICIVWSRARCVVCICCATSGTGTCKD